MIDLYFWPTPNGYKPLIALKEFAIDYRIMPINIFRGEQQAPSFLSVAPNGRIPAIVDHSPVGGGPPVSVFESGAILMYLAERSGALAGRSISERYDVVQWVFWQMGGLGPMMGQASHFINYAPERVPYATDRYVRETHRLFGVIEKQLNNQDFLAGDYSVADMAAYPWVKLHDIVGIGTPEAYPALAAWLGRIAARPAVARAYAEGEPVRGTQTMDDAARPFLFGSPHQ